MNLLDLPSTPAADSGQAFDLDDDRAYRRWRDWKLAQLPVEASTLVVHVQDPYRLSIAEKAALIDRITRCNVAIYQMSTTGLQVTFEETPDKGLPQALGAQLGLHRLDANWLADEDGVSSIQVRRAGGGGAGEGAHAAFIPYTDKAIRWHTDGYYHPAGRTIHAMVLHCVRPAARGGVNTLLDHELAYISLRDRDPALVRALMRPEVMTIPARDDDQGVARAAQTGPVFSVLGGRLHMRYTARKRSIAWRDDEATRRAVAALEGVLDDPATPGRLQLQLQAGMGIVGHNVLHDRSSFDDDPTQPRLLYRARFLDRCQVLDPPWLNG
ncbi:MAG: hypothetical protein RL375_968 [Pseudomonadota bacterium]|jgi:phenylpyruvate tautomerase PptA (4-oxalocrotonate tautomerase family)